MITHGDIHILINRITSSISYVAKKKNSYFFNFYCLVAGVDHKLRFGSHFFCLYVDVHIKVHAFNSTAKLKSLNIIFFLRLAVCDQTVKL